MNETRPGLKPLTRTVKVEVQFLGERGFPAGVARIPEALIHDFNELLAKAREVYPAYTHETLFRYLWIKGLDNLRAVQRIRQLPPPDRPPNPNFTSTGTGKLKPRPVRDLDA